MKIHYSWNEDQIRTCRYIDDYHVEIGNNLYHICEFAERMEYGGHTCEPVRDNLPERCYSVLSGSDEIIIIKRGEKGYFKTAIPSPTRTKPGASRMSIMQSSASARRRKKR